MPYYRGDNYYRGDYYRGDSIFSRIGGALVGGVKGLLTGGLAGAAAGAAKGLVSSGAHPNLPQPKAQIPNVGPLPPAYAGTGPPDIGVDTGSPNNAGGTASMGSSYMIPAFTATQFPGQVTRGMHPNRSTYETRGGGTSRWPHSLMLHAKGTTLVKNRRMNVGNARALKRALRRAGGFARLARRVMSFTHPKSGRGHFKFKRRAKR